MVNKLSDSNLDTGSEINSQNEISNNIRKLLQTSRSISFDNYGEQKVYTVIDGYNEYRFYNDWGDWKMEIKCTLLILTVGTILFATIWKQNHDSVIKKLASWKM